MLPHVLKKHNNNNTSLKFKSYQTEVLEHRVIKKAGRKKATQLFHQIK